MAELLAAVARLADTAIDVGRTRIALLAADVEALQWRLLRVLVLAAACFFSALFAFAALGAFVLAYFWDTHRVAAAGGLTLACVSLGAIFAWRLSTALREPPAPFAGTLDALARDRAALGGEPVP